MTESNYVEYCLLHYVPNVVDNRSALVAALVFDCSEREGGICSLTLDSNWQNKVRAVDPEADVEMLAALFTDIRDRLSSETQRSEMIHQLEDSFSNLIQLSQRRKWKMAPYSAADDAFARELFEKISTKVA
ncbi:MAG TPA: DUF3037 domain-containing protein [Candidatus Sulfotelmatobacter sp.]